MFSSKFDPKLTKNVNDFINRLLNRNIKVSDYNPFIYFENKLKILDFFRDLYKKRGLILEVNSTGDSIFKVCGDLHGSISDLKFILKDEKDYTNLTKYYIFVGDAIDRGGYSYETVLVLILLVRLNPFKVFYLRGNHENSFCSTTDIGNALDTDFIKELVYRYAFENEKIVFPKNEILYQIFIDYKEIHPHNYLSDVNEEMVKRIYVIKSLNIDFKKYNPNTNCIKTINYFKQILGLLPFCMILNVKSKKKKFFFCHGGIPIFNFDFKIPTNFNSLQSWTKLFVGSNNINYDLNSFRKHVSNIDLHDNRFMKQSFGNIFYQVHVKLLGKNYKGELPYSLYNKLDHTYKVLFDMLWSDVQKNNGIYYMVNRGMQIGPDIYLKFLNHNNIDYVIRGHQPAVTMYKNFEQRLTKEKEAMYSFRVHEYINNRVITLHSNEFYNKKVYFSKHGWKNSKGSYMEIVGGNQMYIHSYSVSEKSDVIMAQIEDGHYCIHYMKLFHNVPVNTNHNVKSNILSPISGIIKQIGKVNDKIKIGVYIRGPNDEIQDDHTIFSPYEGKITFKPFKGFFKEQSFFSKSKKVGYIEFVINDLKFNVYVGKGYVTNQIKLVINNGDIVKHGQKLGEIIIKNNNSYADIFLPDYNYNVSIGDVLVGGKTKICIIEEINSQEKNFKELFKTLSLIRLNNEEGELKKGDFKKLLKIYNSLGIDDEQFIDDTKEFYHLIKYASEKYPVFDSVIKEKIEEEFKLIKDIEKKDYSITEKMLHILEFVEDNILLPMLHYLITGETDESDIEEEGELDDTNVLENIQYV